MDLESLRIFSAVAAELGITQAAARLGRAPSNVTTRVQQLEADLGAALFVRSGKRMTLSVAGERFLDYAQRMLALEDEARQVVTGGEYGGVLHLGSMESTAASRLPTLLAAYHTQHPQTRLAVETGPSLPLIESVRTGRLDCAFVALPTALASADALAEQGLCSRPVWQEDLLLLLPTSEQGVTAPAQVRTRSLAAFRQGCTYRALAHALLGIDGAPSWSVQEVGSYHAMIACVAAGTCVALLPASVLALGATPPGVTTLPAGRVETCLVSRTDYAVPAFQRLLRQIGS